MEDISFALLYPKSEQKEHEAYILKEIIETQGKVTFSRQATKRTDQNRTGFSLIKYAVIIWLRPIDEGLQKWVAQ